MRWSVLVAFLVVEATLTVKFDWKFLLVACAMIGLFSGCGEGVSSNGGGVREERVLRVSPGGRVNTLDPALSADLVSAKMVGELYDTPLEYDYLERPYKLKPSMLESMPEVGGGMTAFRLKLRGDLWFQPDKCFGVDDTGCFKRRRVTASDVAFSILRLADERVHSPGYWLIRGKIRGIGEFRKATASSPEWDFSVYDKGCEGIKFVNDRELEIRLAKPDPRFLYALAMPYMSVVPREAVEMYREDFGSHPVGSGPFRLVEWRRGYKLEFERNPDYREEYFREAENAEDRERRLPLLDRVVCPQVSESVTAWFMFLRGELDMNPVDKDNFEAVVDGEGKLVPALRARGVKLVKAPRMQIYYVGFCFVDPILAGNADLRKAISLAYNVDKRMEFFNHCATPANGPIPKGVAGYDPRFENPYAKHDVELAKEYLAKAGFPGGVDPKTGKRLKLTLDFGGTSATFHELAEMFVDDMADIGIKIVPVLNNWPNFLKKSARGRMQLYYVSWVADYPDAENFLQLFYGPNAGSCNRSFFRDSAFDRMFDEIKSMPDTPDRTVKYAGMARYLVERCPWIFSHYPVSYRVLRAWVENYHPHDFCFSEWKYLDVDVEKRCVERRDFKPLTLSEIGGE